MIMDGCIYAWIYLCVDELSYGWLGNYGAKVSKMHTVGRGSIVACDIFLIGGFSHVWLFVTEGEGER